MHLKRSGRSSWPHSSSSPRRPRGPPIRSSTRATLHEFRIVMDPADWKSLRQNFFSNQYYAANISVDGEVLQQVGVRSRGKGSRSGEKPGLLIDTNRYVSNQEFHGLKKLVLDNVIQDASFLHEPLAYQVFEAMGIASPAISYTRLTVNDEYLGRVLAGREHRQELPGRARGRQGREPLQVRIPRGLPVHGEARRPADLPQHLPARDARGRPRSQRPGRVHPCRQHRARRRLRGGHGPLHRRRQVPDLHRGRERDRGAGRLRWACRG